MARATARLMRRWPFLRRIPARVIGIGFRPEHVKAVKVSETRHGLYESGQALPLSGRRRELD